MKERLVIKNFGPIKEVDLELGKVNILIGDQATGKSTIAKVLSVCRYFSYIVNYSVAADKNRNEFCLNQNLKDGFEEWGLFAFFNKNSLIEYSNDLYSFACNFETKVEYVQVDNIGQIEKRFFQVHSKVTSNDNRFEELLKNYQELRNSNKDPFGGIFDVFIPNESFYRLDVAKVMNNPMYIPTERGLQSLFTLGKNADLSDTLYNWFAKFDLIKRTTFINQEIEIKPLDIFYTNSNGIEKVRRKGDDFSVNMNYAASGYQSTTPIVLAVKHYENKKPKTFIVEEPEQNLFPKTQKKLMEFFVESINKYDNQFLLPTHSPYILASLNDLLLAYEKGKTNEKEVAKIVDKNLWLNPDDCSVYELKNGKSYSIMDREMGLIDENIIDSASDEMNEKFNELLNID